MPKVGNKKFSYDEKGIQKAREHAAKKKKAAKKKANKKKAPNKR